MSFKEKIGVKSVLNKLLNKYCGYYIARLTENGMKTLIKATSAECFWNAFSIAQGIFINKGAK